MTGAGVLIAGGGLAAQRCAETLRGRGYDGPVRILCAEAEPPYDRPPLSKQLLAGEVGEETVAFRPAAWYAESEIELLLGRRAERLDPASRTVTDDRGFDLRYEQLLIATGSRARQLPFLEAYSNVHTLRTLADARRLRTELQPGARLAIVGAGFIGQEVAATARRAGLDVTMIEAQATPLAGIFGERIGGWFADLHRSEGTRLLLRTTLERARGGDRVEELVLGDGGTVPCDLVVVGVGSAPATEWLAGSGLEPSAVPVDTAGRTQIPGVFAAGDAAAPFEPRFGVHTRTEHWDAAAKQGSAAAQAMLGDYPGTPPLPSFWSDQYGSRIHYVGHAERSDGVFIEGDPRDRDFVAVFTRAATPVAALAVGRPRAAAALRRRIEQAHWQGQKETRQEAA